MRGERLYLYILHPERLVHQRSMCIRLHGCQIGPGVVGRIDMMTHLHLTVEFLFLADRTEHLLVSAQHSRQTLRRYQVGHPASGVTIAVQKTEIGVV